MESDPYFNVHDSGKIPSFFTIHSFRMNSTHLPGKRRFVYNKYAGFSESGAKTSLKFLPEVMDFERNIFTLCFDNDNYLSGNVL